MSASCLPRSVKSLALFSFVLLLSPSLALADEESRPGMRPINGPTRITRPGSYVLHRSFTLNEDAPAIVIATRNVSLDLNGHTLSGPGNKTGIGILVESAAGVHVHNGKIAAFGTGVQVANSTNVVVENLQVLGLDAGGPPPGEVGVLIVNSQAVFVRKNVISRTFLGIFVRGGRSSGNRIAENTVTGGLNGQLGICYNPDGSGLAAGPTGDLVYNNLISRFNVGIQTSAETRGNIFRENDIAYVQEAINEVTPGVNVVEENTAIQIVL